MMLSHLFPDLAPRLDIDAHGISADSRNLEQGYVFAALEGAKADGRDYIDAAIARGACAILTDQRPGKWAVPALKSSRPRRELALAAARLFPEQPRFIAAVTGTNGKSSVVAFLRQIWNTTGHRAASLGTLGITGPDGSQRGGAMTTPDPVSLHRHLAALAREGCTHCAIEASSHGLHQFRLDGVRLSAGAFTNLTRDHLDYHPDMETYLAAKMRLFQALLPKGAAAIIGADDDVSNSVESTAKNSGLAVSSVGWYGKNLKLAELTPRRLGQDIAVRYRDRELNIHIPLIGSFQAVNALTAAAIALGSGEDADAVFDALGTLASVSGRLEYAGRSGSGGHVYVDYAHTPAGLETLLRAVRPHTPGRIILVFGCGGDRDRGKRSPMGRIAARWAQSVIVTDDNPRSEPPEKIRAGILRGNPDATEIADRRQAIAEGIEQLKSGDSLVIAGKGHENEQIVGGKAMPFNDRVVAREFLLAGGGHV